jgi:hypothetical protein
MCRVNVFEKALTYPWPADNDSLLTPSQTLKMADKLSVTKQHHLLFIMLHCWCIKIINGVRRPTLGSFFYYIPVRFNCVDLFIDGIVIWACATHLGSGVGWGGGAIWLPSKSFQVFSCLPYPVNI